MKLAYLVFNSRVVYKWDRWGLLKIGIGDVCCCEVEGIKTAGAWVCLN